jgi:isoleucyl-tRNA synthetase
VLTTDRSIMTTQAKPGYKSTLNLPKTEFAMKANLAQNEPLTQQRWEQNKLYEQIIAKRAAQNRPAFVFHDGPPYANGTLHVGHLLNKILKDIVVRSRLMMGMQCRFIPGWDCHGLPIEHKVVTELMAAGKFEKLNSLGDDQRRMAIRRECAKHAEKFVKLQASQMKRMLTLADYDHAYLTMTPDYERGVLDTFAALVEQGVVYRALKPVHWSIANQTALAEAELEYEDREDLSIYVTFEAADRQAVARAFGVELDQTPSFMIWTTTPWTLPANLAIAVDRRLQYSLVQVDGHMTVIASDLVEAVTKTARSANVELIAQTSGDQLIGLKYKHPFMQRNEGAFVLDMSNPESTRNAVVSRAYISVNGGYEPNPVALDAVYRIVGADYITLNEGTGLVHTAPGHGMEDYYTGLRESLPIYCPVKGDGTYDKTVAVWLSGKMVWAVNEEIVRVLKSSGHLFHAQTVRHSYPHDWRSKTPVIFRATEQWFIGVDHPLRSNNWTLRELAILAADSGGNAYQRLSHDRKRDWSILPALLGDANAPQNQSGLPRYFGQCPDCAAVKFIPSWGRRRLVGMLESRPDWCISRQRAWGLPIPAFYGPEAGQVLLTAALVRAVAKLFSEKGSDIWFQAGPSELLKYYDPETDPEAPDWFKPSKSGAPPGAIAGQQLRKSGDILDVWFESGSSWHAVMRQRNLGFPTDLYLEGSDQHRGWFQSSLLPSLGVTGQSPFKALLTHGFVVDKDARKMSKSLGNVLEVDDLLKEFGADVCRWWVSSLAFENDIKMDLEFLKASGETYRKVRNTLRFLLSNLYDFDRTAEGTCAHCVPLEAIPPTSIDGYILDRAAFIQKQVREAYDSYEFRRVHQLLYDFCNDTLSAFYCAAVKDRLYCDKPDSRRRRMTQTVMWDLAEMLTRLVAPILPHTADEAFRSLHKNGSQSVHLEEFIEWQFAADADWPKVLEVREAALKALEEAKSRGVENPLDAEIILPDPEGVLKKFTNDLADMLGVSRVTLAPSGDITVNDLRSEPRCERSWKRDGTVKLRSDGGMLCDRCAQAVDV